MSTTSSLTPKGVVTAVSIAVASGYLVKHLIEPSRKCLPPGPKSLPFIGHLLSMPRSLEHVAYARMSQDLKSDIVALSVMGQTIIVLNSAKAASELLEKRSSIYSGRPQIPVIVEKDLLDWGQSVAYLDYNDRWKRDRRMLHESLHKGALPQYYPGQEKQVHALLGRLVDAPSTLGEFKEQAGFAITAGIVHATYGYTPKSQNDDWLRKLAETAEHAAQATLPTSFIVNFIPSLNYLPEWLPGTGWKRLVRRWREEKEYISSAPYAWVKEQIRNNNAVPSIVQGLLSAFPSHTPGAQDDLHIEIMSSTLFGAGSHTTLATIMFFLLAMVLYPDVAIKIQAEIDNVLGDAERLPTMQDREHIPYIQNVILELLRWQPVTPLALPHTVKEADEYKGYHIPKDSIIIGNTWAITRDESIYPDPERFNPDRFLDPNVPPAPAFGFGRRVCPGNHFAEVTLFLLISSLMYVFDIRRAGDENGDEIVPEVKIAVDSSLTCKPESFKFIMRPRSEAHERLVRSLDVHVS